MKKLLIIFLLCISGCSGYVKVDDGIYQHGAVPQENPAKSNQVVVEKDSYYAFWLVYLPILSGVLYVTWKTFKSTKNSH